MLQVTEIEEISASRRPGQTERSAHTEQRILDAAEVVFARRGLTGTRVREIAEAACVNGATLYNYYPSKDALYEAVLDRGIPPLSAILAEFATASDEVESARRAVRAVMQHLAARPHLSKLIYLEAISEGDFLPKLASRWFRPLLQQIVGELQARPAPAHLEEALFARVATLFIHLSFGHFALAPLVDLATGEDSISKQGVEHQTRLIEILIDQLFPRFTESAKQDAKKDPSAS